jgi:hypothetical protein
MLRRAGGAAALGASIAVLAACGSSNQSDISSAVAKANSTLASQGVGVKLTCPTTVNTNSPFNCTYTNKATGKSATVTFHVTGSNHNTLDVVNENAAKAAVAKIVGNG